MILFLLATKTNSIQLRSGTNYPGDQSVYQGIDRVSGFTFGQIYALLTNDITEIPKLKSKIIAQYPNKNTNGEIIELFNLYGY